MNVTRSVRSGSASYLVIVLNWQVVASSSPASLSSSLPLCGTTTSAAVIIIAATRRRRCNCNDATEHRKTETHHRNFPNYKFTEQCLSSTSVRWCVVGADALYGDSLVLAQSQKLLLVHSCSCCRCIRVRVRQAHLRRQKDPFHRIICIVDVHAFAGAYETRRNCPCPI